MDNIKIEFSSTDRQKWLAHIEGLHNQFADMTTGHRVSICFNKSILADNIEPLHLVTLACLIHYLKEKGCDVSLSISNSDDINEYIYNDLDFSAYWSGGLNHIEAHKSENIFNLWRITEEEKDLYSMSVERYFKRNYFNDKDLSAISVSLAEAYYNVFDHAKAGGNAFSLLKYDEEKQRLHVAIADFGCGIPSSVRSKHKGMSDVDALEWALKDHSSIHSTFRNKGFGMSNILSAGSEARIFSGNALMVKSPSITEFYTVGFSFPGTLIYLEVDLASFEEELVLDTFEF